jgi:TetR/AcrR family transcriptional regulator
MTTRFESSDQFNPQSVVTDQPPGRRSKAQMGRDNTLAQIRTAAITEFSLHGLKGASTQAIAKRAKLTQPQLYYYIASKDALYEELLKMVFSDWADFEFDASSEDPVQVLSDYIRQKLEYAFREPELSRIFTRECLDGGAGLEKFWPDAAKSANRKVTQIKHWMDKGLMPEADPGLLLIHVWAVTQFYADSEVQVRNMLPDIGGEPYQETHVVEQVTQFILRGYGLQPP